MLRRALRRAWKALRERPAEFIGANLLFSAALCVPLLAWALAAWLKAPRLAIALLGLLGAAWAWLAFNFLAFLLRRSMEHQGPPSLAAFKTWIQARALERLAAFAVLALAFFWSGLARDFYRAASQSWGAARIGSGIAWALSLFLALSAFLNFGLASRHERNWKGEWKAAALMALAFAPQALGGLLLSLLFSGGAALVAGLDTFLGRVLWIPAIMAPLFGAGLLAAFAVALTDEFLAKSLGREAPGA